MSKAKNRGAVFSPESYCPICGVRYVPEHRCSFSVLRAINAANTRAGNADHDGEDAYYNLKMPDLTQRLKFGFSLNSDDEPDRNYE